MNAIKDYVAEDISLLSDIPPKLSDAIVSIMNKKNITIEDLSAASGLDRKTIIDLRKDKKQNIRPETIFKLCKGLKLNPFALLFIVRYSGIMFKINASDADLFYSFLSDFFV